MRKILKDFYYGNLTPSEGDLAANSNLRRAMVKVSQCESQLAEQLNEAERILLAELVKAQMKLTTSPHWKASSWASVWAFGSWQSAWMTTMAISETEVNDHGQEKSKWRGQPAQAF